MGIKRTMWQRYGDVRYEPKVDFPKRTGRVAGRDPSVLNAIFSERETGCDPVQILTDTVSAYSRPILHIRDSQA